MYDAVLFDNDGVLTYLTSLDALERAIETTFAEFGVTDPDRKDVEALYGITVEDLRRVCDRYDLDPEAFWRRRDRNAALAQHAEIRAGAKPLYEDVAALDALDLPMGVVSNNQADTVAYIVEYFDVPEFAVCYGRPPTIDGLRRKKPNPYYLRKAVAALAAESVLYVGDSEKDVVAARRAGIDSAFVRRPHRRELVLSASPTYEIEGLDALAGIVDGDARGVQSQV